MLYNNHLLHEQELQVPVSDRAFQYNDGFFETAIIADGRLRFWAQHQQRMQEAAEALQLQVPAYFFDTAFEEQLLALARQEAADRYGRLKLKVWRAGAGLYTPNTNAVNWLATAQPASPAPCTPLHIGVCRNVHTVPTPLSQVKGPNAPLYVLAGLEKQAQQKDDLLLLSAAGMVSEMISSNVFWLRENVLYTPALETGCVKGILRRNIIGWCQSQGIACQEVKHAPEQLLQAEAVFAANVTGIRGVASINGAPVRQQESFLTMLRQGLHL